MCGASGGAAGGAAGRSRGQTGAWASRLEQGPGGRAEQWAERSWRAAGGAVVRSSRAETPCEAG
eukprot:3835730-Alexandrium_andersonii.AAC.1